MHASWIFVIKERIHFCVVVGNGSSFFSFGAIIRGGDIIGLKVIIFHAEPLQLAKRDCMGMQPQCSSASIHWIIPLEVGIFLNCFHSTTWPVFKLRNLQLHWKPPELTCSRWMHGQVFPISVELAWMGSSCTLVFCKNNLHSCHNGSWTKVCGETRFQRECIMPCDAEHHNLDNHSDREVFEWEAI